MIKKIITLYKKECRRAEADRKGWMMLGQLFRLLPSEANSFKAQWLVRNMNRLYRLARGHGNPWKLYKGF